ncbi:MAG: alpha/beta fold hydrolase, partial [Salegentibacter sp.]
MKNKLLLLFVFVATFCNTRAQKSELSVEKIMQDPSWMGTFPSNIHWGAQSDNIYFDYNPDGDPSDSLYRINIHSPGKIVEVSPQEKKKLVPQSGNYNEKRTKKVFTEEGHLVLYDSRSEEKNQLLDLGGKIENPQFLKDESKISFVFNNNAFVYDLKSGSIKKITNIENGRKKAEDEELSPKAKFLQQENLKLLQVVNERKEKKESSKEYREAVNPKEFTFYMEGKKLSDLRISPNAEYVSFRLIATEKSKGTKIPNFVDKSGYTVDIPGRSKVGDENTHVQLALYNLEKDTVFIVNTDNLPGITDLPDYVKDYPDKEWEKTAREVIPSSVYFSENGKKGVVNLRSKDNKDRWIAEIDLQTGELHSLERQRDEAWIGGPGIGYTFDDSETLGWLPDNQHIYYQSEETGYSHLYLLNVDNGRKKQLTEGKFEVFDPFLSNNKKYWYLTTSEVGPGERHFYRMPVMGGKMEQLTHMEGNNQVSLSPDEKYLAIRHSYSNKPWELYLKKNSSGGKPQQLTHGQSEAFSSYNWKDPKLIKFQTRDGAMVPARLYTPDETAKNNAAIVFVHGAGYLQNVHKWWSDYFREYMFNNLLTDLGYTVIDIDYRGSAGYGRDWRTAIYRHMGGKDLSDQVDGVKYLLDNYDIDPKKVGIYGGSYGGFMTLMAMFTEPEIFKSGAALRSVTDWAHYNHGYTSDILNEPAEDPIAYRRSSPIYFAEGLQGN